MEEYGIKVDVCGRHQLPSNTFCCYMVPSGATESPCTYVLCSSCIAERQSECAKYPCLRDISHLVCHRHFQARVEHLIDKREAMVPIEYIVGDMTPFATSLFPKFEGVGGGYGGDGGGGGDGEGGNKLVCVPASKGILYDDLVKNSIVKGYLLKLTKEQSSAPPAVVGSETSGYTPGKINTVFCRGYIGLLVWKLIACDRVDDEYVPWYKGTSFSDIENRDKFDGVLASLFRVYKSIFIDIQANMSVKSFTVQMDGLINYKYNLIRKYKTNCLWTSASNYEVKGLYAHHVKLFVQMGYSFKKVE